MVKVRRCSPWKYKAKFQLQEKSYRMKVGHVEAEWASPPLISGSQIQHLKSSGQIQHLKSSREVCLKYSSGEFPKSKDGTAKGKLQLEWASPPPLISGSQIQHLKSSGQIQHLKSSGEVCRCSPWKYKAKFQLQEKSYRKKVGHVEAEWASTPPKFWITDTAFEELWTDTAFEELWKSR